MFEFEKTLTPAFERHYPLEFSECKHAKKTNDILKRIVNNTSLKNGLPNLLLFGTDGSGKYSRAMILLCNLFNLKSLRNGSVKALDPDTGSFVMIPGTGVTKKTQKAIFVYTSQYHCEIDIQQSNAEKALIPFLDYYSKTKNAFFDCHKYVIIRHANRISQKVQNALRKVMEMKSNNVRFIVTSKSKNGWIEPLQSRFLCIPVPSPNEKEAISILKGVAQKEKWHLTPVRIKKIMEYAYYGDSRSINITEMLMIAEGSFLISDKTFKLYEPDRVRVVNMLIEEMRKGNREKIRDVIEKIAVCMGDQFNMILTGEVPRCLLKEIDNDKKQKLIELTSYWNHRLSDDTIFYPILTGEAYIFAVCDLLY